MSSWILCASFFFFNDTATTEIYTLSLHDALPICGRQRADQLAQWHVLALLLHLPAEHPPLRSARDILLPRQTGAQDRKSTRLNSSHANISYAVFCLKKKNKTYHVLIMQQSFCV